MTVEWYSSRWPRLAGAALKLLRPSAPEQGVLRIKTDARVALGRLEIRNSEGTPMYALIDARKNRDKTFILPASLCEEAFHLYDESGSLLFSTGTAPDPGAKADAGTIQTADAEEDRPAEGLSVTDPV